MSVPRGVTVCLLVMMTLSLSLSLDAAASPVSSQESDNQHSRRLQRLEAEMEILRKFVTEVKQDCRSGLQGPQTSMLWRVAQEVSELRAHLQEAEMRKELSNLRERLSTLQTGLHTGMSGVEGMKANQTKESNLPQRPKVAFLGKFPNQDGGKIRIPASAPLNFTEVFDIGNGFEEGEGVYTVPYSGVYLINFQVFPHEFKDNLVDLKMNGKTLVRSRPGSGLPDTYSNNEQYEVAASSGIVVVASAGDRIWLQTKHEGLFWAEHHTFLSVVLIIADD